MSALGQKRTCAVQKVMSALPRKRTLLATLARQARGHLRRVIDRSPIRFRSPELPSALCSRDFFQGAICGLRGCKSRRNTTELAYDAIGDQPCHLPKLFPPFEAKSPIGWTGGHLADFYPCYERPKFSNNPPTDIEAAPWQATGSTSRMG